MDCSVLLRSNCSVQPGVKILDTNSSLQLQSGNSVAGAVALWHCGTVFVMCIAGMLVRMQII